MIVETNLVFRGTLARRAQTDTVVLHHTASPPWTSIHHVHQWHITGNGWAGAGYHYLIRAHGTIERGRPEDTIGAHTRGRNTTSIGIALAGDFELQRPTKAQADALRWLLADIRSRYGDLAVGGHKEYSATSCPGRYFPWEAVPLGWKDEIIQQALEEGLITQPHNPDDVAPKWFVLAVGLNILRKE